jgi:hypothetical protein
MILTTSRLSLAAVALFSFLPAILARPLPIRLAPSDAAVGARTGAAVAADHDSLVVGAPDDDVTGPLAGSVYVYIRNGNTWEQQAKVIGPVTKGHRSFGESVGISRNLMVVGAPLEGARNNPTGAAYVYVRVGTQWTLEAKLAPADSAGNQQFGNAVAIDGGTIVVGAYLDSATQLNAGAAYVFTRSNGRWIQRAKLVASDLSAFAFFGSAVAIDRENIVVGSPTAETAYLFSTQNGSWKQRAILVPFDAVSGDYTAFGSAVDIKGNTIIVGAPSEGMEAVLAGAAYLFKVQIGGCLPEGKLMAPDGGEEDEFGTSVAVTGQVFAVGAPYHGSINQGAVYVFMRTANDAPLKAEFRGTEIPATFLGTSVCATDDALFAGAPAFKEYPYAPAGAAYIFQPHGGK